MKQELELLRAEHPRVDTDIATPFDRLRETMNPHRAAIRIASETVVREGLEVGDMAKIATAACATMLTVAETLYSINLEPDVNDLVDGARLLMEAARHQADKGLMMRDAAMVQCGSVMIELVVKGICYSLGIDYEALLPIVHAGDDDAIRAFLRSKGYKLEDLSNDE